MMPLLRLAWRNLWRHKTRTWLLVLVVAYATGIMVLFWGYLDGIFGSMVDSYARYLAAPVRVAQTSWLQDPDPENALASLEFTSQLGAIPQVRAAVPRLEFPALLRSAYIAEGVQVKGIDPALEGRVSLVPQKIAQGRLLQAPGEAVLGQKLAERVDVRLGERIVLDAVALTGPQAKGLRVVGLVHTGIAALDETLVLVHLNDARALTGVKTATTLDLDVAKGQEIEVARAVQVLLPADMQARPVIDLMGVMKADIEYHRISYTFFGMVLAVMVTFAVTSTVLVGVIERTRELGMMEALGLEPRALAGMVTLESLLATALGALVGLVLGYALIGYLSTHNVLGSMMSFASESFSQFGLADEIYTSVKPVYALYALAVVALAGVLSLLIPARRVLRLKPVEAMRAG